MDRLAASLLALLIAFPAEARGLRAVPTASFAPRVSVPVSSGFQSRPSFQALPDFRVAPVALPSLDIGVAPAEHAEQRPETAVTSLSRVVGRSEGVADLAFRSAGHFDGGLGLGLNRVSPVSASRDIRIPPGARGVHVETARTRADIDRLIPANNNSHELIQELKRRIGQMGSLDVWTYADAHGGSFTAIDLAGRPDLVDSFPEFLPHERAAVRKIMRYTKDVKVMVRETGKTPDLIVNGIPTELKMDKGKFGPSYGLAKANLQVLQFSARHGLSEGQVVIDVESWGSPRREVALEEAEQFRQKTRTVGLENIFFFGGQDFVRIERGTDGRYGYGPKAFPSPDNFNGRVFGSAHWGWNRERIRRGGYSDLKPHEVQAALDMLDKIEDVIHGKKVKGKRGRTPYDVVSKMWDRFKSSHSTEVGIAFDPLAELLFSTAKGYRSSEKRGTNLKKKKKGRGRGRKFRGPRR